MNTPTIDLEKMRDIGKITAQCLKELKDFIQPGVSTGQIGTKVFNYEFKHTKKFYNAQHGYQLGLREPFPGWCCTSVNHVICHGIPNPDKILHKGDIVKVDVTFHDEDKWHGDSCVTFEVGKPSVKGQRVSDAARDAMYFGIEAAKPGNTIGDIAKTIDGYIKAINMSVVRDHTGHGIGQKFHQFPVIPHWYDPKLSYLNDIRIEPGMAFTIEPMINLGKPDYKVLGDGWTTVTRDKSLSAQWEHTIYIHENGPEILTQYETN